MKMGRWNGKRTTMSASAGDVSTAPCYHAHHAQTHKQQLTGEDEDDQCDDGVPVLDEVIVRRGDVGQVLGHVDIELVEPAGKQRDGTFEVDGWSSSGFHVVNVGSRVLRGGG
jgi:hypothetical protein